MNVHAPALAHTHEFDEQTTAFAEDVIGNLAQETSGGSCADADYQRKTLSSGATGPVVAADSAGGLWLILGDDSGYEGYLKFYWIDGTIQLVPV